MRKLRWVLLGGLLVCGCLMGHLSVPFWGPRSAVAGQAQEAKKADAVAPQDQERELDIRYAEAYLAAMEATLARYEEANRVAPNSVRPNAVQTVQDAIRKARERVQLAKSDDAGDAATYVTSAEADLRMAEDALRRAQATNARSARAVTDGEVARLKTQVALAQVRIEKAKHLASESPLSNVRYELDRLREDVQELQINMALIRRN